MKRQLFTLYDCAWMKNYILTTDPANTLPKCYKLNGDLLVTCYEKTIQTVFSYITAERYLNFTTNETFNIWKRRAQRRCMVVQEKRAYYIYFETINNLNESLNESINGQ